MLIQVKRSGHKLTFPWPEANLNDAEINPNSHISNNVSEVRQAEIYLGEIVYSYQQLEN